MLEKYSDMEAAEAHLNHYLPSIKLLGQIPLSKDDVERINQYIKNTQIGYYTVNLNKVIRKTPTILACYLVWKGIENYNEGTYWISVKDDLGPIDGNIQGTLGDFFRFFLKSNDLLLVDIPGAKRNITPILLHSIIPRESVKLFFSRIIEPLVRRELVNPRDATELDYWLKTRREKALVNDRSEIGDVELQIVEKEGEIQYLEEELAAIPFHPEHEDTLPQDIIRVEQLLNSDVSDSPDIKQLTFQLNKYAIGFRIYEKLGLSDPGNEVDFPTFQHAIYRIILERIQNMLTSEDISVRNEAKCNLEVFYSLYQSGMLSLPEDIGRELEEIQNGIEN